MYVLYIVICSAHFGEVPACVALCPPGDIKITNKVCCLLSQIQSLTHTKENIMFDCNEIYRLGNVTFFNMPQSLEVRRNGSVALSLCT